MPTVTCQYCQSGPTLSGNVTGYLNCSIDDHVTSDANRSIAESTVWPGRFKRYWSFGQANVLSVWSWKLSYSTSHCTGSNFKTHSTFPWQLKFPNTSEKLCHTLSKTAKDSCHVYYILLVDRIIHHCCMGVMSYCTFSHHWYQPAGHKIVGAIGGLHLIFNSWIWSARYLAFTGLIRLLTVHTYLDLRPFEWIQNNYHQNSIGGAIKMCNDWHLDNRKFWTWVSYTRDSTSWVEHYKEQGNSEQADLSVCGQ